MQKKLAQGASEEEKWSAGIEGHSFYRRKGPLDDAIGRVEARTAALTGLRRSPWKKEAKYPEICWADLLFWPAEVVSGSALINLSFSFFGEASTPPPALVGYQSLGCARRSHDDDGRADGPALDGARYAHSWSCCLALNIELITVYLQPVYSGWLTRHQVGCAGQGMPYRRLTLREVTEAVIVVGCRFKRMTTVKS